MSRLLPDRRKSAAVIIGVGAYRHLPALPAVAGNREQLQAVLTAPEVWGLPEDRCRTVPDPATPAALIDPVIDAAQKATDTLIVYYAGHGFIDRSGALYLTLPESRNRRTYTALRYADLRQAILEHSQASRRIVILDCCYSGLALEGMSDPAAGLPAAASISGSYILTSTAENVQALSPKKEQCTAFTAELTRVLQNGVAGGGEFLTLHTVYRHVKNALKDKNRPEPQEQDRGSIGSLPFVRNNARKTPGPPPRRPRTRIAAATAGALLLAAAPAAWKLTTGADGDTADCSPHASLLGFSDSLDKTRYHGHAVAGLSSLATSRPAQLLTLSDTSPPRLYTLSLKSPAKADTRITGATELRRKDGTTYTSDEFDAEAMALEKDGRTVLVASESGPSVSRFDTRTGRLLDGFPVPDRFGIAPEGTAQLNESFEAMALSTDGRHLYVGLESPLSGDGSRQGRSPVRILRYQATPGGGFVPDRQYAYETGSGLRLADLVATGENDTLLALERGYSEGQGNAVRTYRLSLRGLPDVSGRESLAKAPAEAFAAKTELFDLAECPESGARALQKQPNPLLENVEGATLGPPLTEGRHKGRRVLHLVSDDNAHTRQTTRLYALAVDLP